MGVAFGAACIASRGFVISGDTANCLRRAFYQINALVEQIPAETSDDGIRLIRVGEKGRGRNEQYGKNRGKQFFPHPLHCGSSIAERWG